MAADLARLTPEQISIAANKRATTDEFVCEPAAVQPIVEGLVRLANRASETGRTFYFLMSREGVFQHTRRVTTRKFAGRDLTPVCYSLVRNSVTSGVFQSTGPMNFRRSTPARSII